MCFLFKMCVYKNAIKTDIMIVIELSKLGKDSFYPQ
jgi:hypothetical protein